MCGIAGYFSNGKKGNDVAIMVATTIMAREMESRGNHSWGSTDGETIARHVGPISKTFSVPQRIPRNFALHTRYATTGKVKQTNSHPFAIGGKELVIGMHNGIISNHDSLNRAYKRSYRVDSQHIFGHIAEGLPLDDLDGYGTIVYRAGSEWYIGSFNGGELAVAQTRAGIFFASTHRALDTALVAAGLADGARDIITSDNAIYRLTESGLKVAYRVHVGETSYKWDDAITSKGKGKKKGKHNSASTGITGQSYGALDSHFHPDTCQGCGDILELNVEGTLCQYCEYVSVYETGGTDWELEVVPEGAEMVCDECQARIGEYEEMGVKGTSKLCGDCLIVYDSMSEPTEVGEMKVGGK